MNRDIDRVDSNEWNYQDVDRDFSFLDFFIFDLIQFVFHQGLDQKTFPACYLIKIYFIFFV